VAFEPQGFESLPRRHDPNPQPFKEYLEDLRLAQSTIQYKQRLIRHLELRFNLYNSDAIKAYIRRSKWGSRRKNNVSYAYKDWCRWKGFDYEFERFKEEEQPLPYIPFEKELDQLIAGFGPKYSAFLQLLKETGFRSVEARRITPENIDTERKVITLNKPAKNSRPRQFKISNQLVSMLIPLIKTETHQRI
jgi:integrase